MIDFDHRRFVEQMAQEALPIGPQGRPTKENSGVNSHLLFRGTGNAPYLTSRIARDHPDILEDMKSGNNRSVRAAAIDAWELCKFQSLKPPNFGCCEYCHPWISPSKG